MDLEAMAEYGMNPATRNSQTHGSRRGGMLTVAVALLLCAVRVAPAENAPTDNLLPNGGFEDRADPLAGWRANFEADGNRWYADNHQFVSVVPGDSGRHQVLRISVPTASLSQNQGVQVDSMPIPFDSGSRYRLSLVGRTTGPNCRILIEGYQWRPGIKPVANPEFHQLRKVYRQGAGQMLYFSGDTQQRSGPFSNPRRTWEPGSCTFPGEELSAAARSHLARVTFVAIHIVAIGGGTGELFLDDVVLEKLTQRTEK
jgi:hypothetical protein